MKSFWETLKKSIFGPDFYREIPVKPAGSAFGYFFLLITILSLITTVAVAIPVVPRVMSFLNNLRDHAVAYYPDNLEITAKGGQISTNVTEPYFFPLPPELKSAILSNSNVNTVPTLNASTTNLLVIDTKSQFTLDLFKNYNTIALLTEDSLVYYDHDSIEIQPLNHVPDGTLSKAEVESWMETLDKVLRFVPAAVVIFIFCGLFIASSFELVYLLFGALIIWLILMVRKMPGGYKASYKIALYAATISLIVSNLFVMFAIPSIPLLFTAIFTIVVLVNLQPGNANSASTSNSTSDSAMTK